MRQPLRPSPRVLTLLCAALVAASCGSAVVSSRPGSTPSSAATAAPAATTARPAPGHELYGFVPYWEIDATIVDHLASSPVKTVALFSVTNAVGGLIDTTKAGYKKITGTTGRAVIDAVHQRGGRVDLVFTSFGTARNKAFFRKPAVQKVAIASVVELAAKLSLDGIALDVEQLDQSLLPAYGSFVGKLREALVAALPNGRLTVSTGAGASGAAIAAAAVQAGVDRVFLMGYDYRIAGSDPGATSPLDRADGGHDLAWSLDLYASAGVPAERTLLGLPLYGMIWPVAGPGLGAPSTGNGVAWIPADHAAFLAASAASAVRDDVEAVDVYFTASDGTVGMPAPEATPSGSGEPTWKAIYVDSPATLARKLELGLEYGLAGAGFWALGYERGLPGYTDMLRGYLKGEVLSAQ